MSKKKKQAKTRGGLREKIMGKPVESDFDIEKREVHIMTRLSEDIVEVIDALVTLNVFKSRSEAVAAYIENAIVSNGELYQRLIKQAKGVTEMRDSALNSIFEALQKEE